MMLTTDLSLKEDPAYRKISKRFLENPKDFELVFAKAWFKLAHRDKGPRARYVGDQVPSEALIWQDPIPEVDYQPIGKRDVEKLKAAILDSGLTVPELVRTAWAAAASYRGTYSGWNAAVYVAGDLRDPRRDLLPALWLATLGVTGLYLAFNAVLLYAAPATARTLASSLLLVLRAPWEALAGGGSLLLGLPVYALRQWRRGASRPGLGGTDPGGG